jgi:hypothetical protein
MILEFTIVALVLSYFLVVWLKTDAFAEYMLLFRLTKVFHMEEYKQLRADGYDGNYIDFLVEYYKDKFFVRLLACPVCVSFWLGVVLVATHGLGAIVVPPLTLFFYLLFNKLM